jgi:hypothetical protein
MTAPDRGTTYQIALASTRSSTQAWYTRALSLRLLRFAGNDTVNGVIANGVIANGVIANGVIARSEATKQSRRGCARREPSV